MVFTLKVSPDHSYMTETSSHFKIHQVFRGIIVADQNFVLCMLNVYRNVNKASREWRHPWFSKFLGVCKNWPSMAILLCILLHTDMTQAVEILPHGNQGPTWHILSIPWLLMPWRCKEQGHQQKWYWPSSLEYSICDFLLKLSCSL